MASLAQKLGHLMLHNASDWDQSIAFRNPTSSRIDKIPVPQATWVFNNASATNVSTNSAQGVATGRSTSFNGKSSTFAHSLMSVTMTGYITSGTYYWSWALKNTTTGNFVPIVGRAGRYAASAKTRTVSTIQGNQSMNCVAPYRGSVHSYASQNWVTFDCSNETNGDVLEVWVSASDQPGGNWYDNASQSVYIKEVVMCYGYVTGFQYDHTYSNS